MSLVCRPCRGWRERERVCCEEKAATGQSGDIFLNSNFGVAKTTTFRDGIRTQLRVQILLIYHVPMVQRHHFLKGKLFFFFD